MFNWKIFVTMIVCGLAGILLGIGLEVAGLLICVGVFKSITAGVITGWVLIPVGCFLSHKQSQWIAKKILKTE